MPLERVCSRCRRGLKPALDLRDISVAVALCVRVPADRWVCFKLVFTYSQALNWRHIVRLLTESLGWGSCDVPSSVAHEPSVHWFQQSDPCPSPWPRPLPALVVMPRLIPAFPAAPMLAFGPAVQLCRAGVEHVRAVRGNGAHPTHSLGGQLQ